LTTKNENGKVTNLGWDFENRLTQVVTPSSGTVSYKYDALGRRIQRTGSDGVATNFTYDGQDVMKDVNNDGSTVDYLNGPGIDNKVRQTSTAKKKSTALYYETDHLGSTTALTNDKGHAADEITYDAFGNGSGSKETRYDYTGRERDPLTGLMFYRARWYDSQVGRFISEDPIGLAGGINQFAYVGNNPLNATDPLGLDILIIEQGPTGNNPIGHTGIAITGRGVFSFGNGRELATDAKGNIIGGDLAGYIYRESRNRDTWIYIIKTTPEQDAAVEAELRAIAQNEPALQAESSILSDNCSTRSNRGLDAGDIRDGGPKIGKTLGPNVPGSSGQRAGLTGANGELIPRGAGWMPTSLAPFIRH